MLDFWFPFSDIELTRKLGIWCDGVPILEIKPLDRVSFQITGVGHFPHDFAPLGAHASAGMYSLVETAKANNLDPFHFMYRLFKELPEAETEEAFEKLLPWNMTGIPAYKLETGKN